MEFKEAIKIRRRMCNYYVECDDCPLYKPSRYCKNFPMSEEEIDEYEKILEEWAKEHPVVTNAEKYIEVIKNTFGAKLNETQMSQVRGICVKGVVGLNVACNTTHCSECMKWWNEEYKEPVKEKSK